MSKINISYNKNVTEDVQLPIFFDRVETRIDYERRTRLPSMEEAPQGMTTLRGTSDYVPRRSLIGIISKLGVVLIYLDKKGNCRAYSVEHSLGDPQKELLVKIKKEWEGHSEISERSFLEIFHKIERLNYIFQFLDIKNR